MYESIHNDKFKNKSFYVTPEEMAGFLLKYKIGLVLYDINCKEIFNSYIDVLTPNTNVKPNIIRLIYHNEHVYIIDKKREFAKEIVVKHNNNLLTNEEEYIENEDDETRISNLYQIKKNDSITPLYEKICLNIDDIIEFLIDLCNNEDKKNYNSIICLVNISLNDVFHYFLTKVII